MHSVDRSYQLNSSSGPPSQCTVVIRDRFFFNSLGLFKGEGAGSDSEKEFVLDGIFEASCAQDSLFRESGVQQMLNHALVGYSATIFAYGQTGSGKTFTMSGDESQFQNGQFRPTSTSGLIPRSLTYLANRIEALRQANPFTMYIMQASFLEIYNEVPRDLLSPALNTKSNLVLRLGQDGAFFIENQIVVDCQSYDDLMAVFTQGSGLACPIPKNESDHSIGHRNRHVAGHALNSDSSRSHCIMTIKIISSGISLVSMTTPLVAIFNEGDLIG